MSDSEGAQGPARDDSATTDSTGLSRRQTLKTIAGGSIAATTGLAGCLQQIGGGSGSGIGTPTFGILTPNSGPSAPLGKSQRQGAKVGVEYVNNSDEFDFELNALYEDTQTKPSVGRQKATRMVKQDGANFLIGALESSVALAVADYVKTEDLLYNSGAAVVSLTGEKCNKNTFRAETNAAQQMAGLADFAAAELGSKWWIHTTDDAYGQSAVNQIERRINAQGLDVDIVGRTMPEKGTGNYSPYISQISNSDAEVVVLPETGGDLIRFMKQASSSGLKSEVDIIGTALFAKVSRGALGNVAVGTYSSTLYNHKLDTGDNKQFVDAFRSMHDATPGSFARVGYELVRMTARGIKEAGSDDPEKVRSALEGLDMQTVLGQSKYRACDHQAVNPVWTGKIVEGKGIPDVKMLSKVDGQDAIRPCSETGCSL